MTIELLVIGTREAVAAEYDGHLFRAHSENMLRAKILKHLKRKRPRPRQWRIAEDAS